jgi:hypothetical protein
LNKIKYYFVITLFSTLSGFISAQLKYVGENKSVTEVSIMYSSVHSSGYAGAQINFTQDGKVGIGASFLISSDKGKGIGLDGEYGIIRPINGTAIGTNLFLTGSIIWVSSSNDNFNYNKSSSTSTTKSGTIGMEIYLHLPDNIFKAEPFVQIARTFTNVPTTTDYSESTSLNSIGVGVDLFLMNQASDYFILTPGIIFAEHTYPAFEIDISFIYRKK